jgi:hypothetical protein
VAIERAESAPSRQVSDNLPNFFVIGVPKAATTTLNAVLDQHPDVFTARMKETSFFSWDDEYRKGLDYYERTHFAGAASYLARGEATPGYLASAVVRERIASALPPSNHRFIVVLRDPTDRAWSHYRYNVMHGVERLSFSDALDAERSGHREDPYQSGVLCYRFHGSYGTHLARWLGHHPRDAFLILRFEDVVTRPDETYAAMFDFLGVDRIEVAPTRENSGSVSRFGLLGLMNRTPEGVRRQLRRVVPFPARHRVIRMVGRVDRKSASEPIDPSVADRLRTEMAPEVEQAADLTGLDLSSWLPR